MFKKAVLKNVLLLSNVVGVVVGACVLLCYLVLVTVRRALGVPFRFSAVDQLEHFLLVGGALMLCIGLVGYCALLKADCAGNWLLIPYIIALSVITGIQIYILVVLFMNKNAIADDVEESPKLRETVGRFRDTVAPSKLPDSNIITIFTTPKGTHKERVKRQLSLFDQAYERIKGDKNNETKVLDSVNNTETETLRPINKQHENVKNFIGFTKSNLQLIRNNSLETRFFNVTRAASKARREFEDMVTQMRRATNIYNMTLARSNSRKFAENAWRDQNKYIDLLKPILGNNETKVLDPVNNTETETLRPINKQHENVKNFIGFTKSNLQLIRNNSLKTRFFNVTRAASKAKEFEDMVTQMRRATNTYNMTLARSNSRKFAENAWRDQNKYIDLLKPILGNSSRPILTISKSSPVLKSGTGVVIFQILYYVMVVIFAVLKGKSEDTK